MSPKDVVPGNLVRSRPFGVSTSGFACAADRISGQAVLDACATFNWSTEFVLLPLQNISLLVEEIGQEAFDRVDSDQPLLTQTSLSNRIMISADREFVAALRSGRSALGTLLAEKESQLFARLKNAIEGTP